MKKLFAFVALLALLVTSSTVTASAAGLSGKECRSPGKTIVNKGFQFKCKKVSGKQKWIKGKRISLYPLPSLSSPDAFSELDACKLQIGNWDSFVRLGFPRHPRAMKNTGDVRGLMVFVQFKDLKGNDNPLVEGLKFTENFEKFYKAQSYGKLNIEVDIHPTYLDIERSSSDYGMNVWDKGDPVLYFNDGVNVARQATDLSRYDFLVVMPPAEIKDIIYGPAFPAGSVRTPIAGKPDFAGTVGGADQRTKGDSTGWIWLGHEVGHLLGMTHQYGYWPSPVWDLMDNVYITTGPELYGWNRFIQDWMSANQVACLKPENLDPGEKIVTTLTPIQAQDDNRKLVLLRLSDTEVIAMEYRAQLGFDHLTPYTRGVVAYKVKPRAGMNEGGITLLEPTVGLSKFQQNYGTMRLGDSARSDGYKISVISLTSKQAIVQIERVS